MRFHEFPKLNNLCAPPTRMGSQNLSRLSKGRRLFLVNSPVATACLARISDLLEWNSFGFEGWEIELRPSSALDFGNGVISLMFSVGIAINFLRFSMNHNTNTLSCKVYQHLANLDILIY